MQTTAKKPMIIGLTGFIGSGKSTARMCLEEEDAATIDADQVVREVLRMPLTIHEMRRRFGDALIVDGEIHRPSLAAIIFQDTTARKDAEAIIRPMVSLLIQEWLKWIAMMDADVAVIEAIDLSFFELRLHEAWIITCDDEIRFTRLLHRGLLREEAEQRLSVQRASSLRLLCPQVEIVNNGSEEELRRTVHVEVARIRQQPFHAEV